MPCIDSDMVWELRNPHDTPKNIKSVEIGLIKQGFPKFPYDEVGLHGELINELFPQLFLINIA